MSRITSATPPQPIETDKTDDVTSDDDDRRITLNVGGVRHETYAETLRRLPGTRLARLAGDQERDETFDPATGEYFFDRHSEAFRSVLELYRTDELHVNNSICGCVLQQVGSIYRLDTFCTTGRVYLSSRYDLLQVGSIYRLDTIYYR
jgi:BTB/POZ domain